MNSLRLRLLVMSALVLVSFVILTGLALERGFRAGARQAVEDRLRGLAYGVLAAVEVDAGGNVRVEAGDIAEARLRQPASGLVAFLVDENQSIVWRSPSLAEDPIIEDEPTAVGDWRFTHREPSDIGTELYLSFGFEWSGENDLGNRFTLVVSEDGEAYRGQVMGFRTTLWTWLGGAVAILLLVQIVLLQWGLSPLRSVAAELEAVRHGGKEKISGDVPSELQPLTKGLNSLLAHERGQQTRYRNALDDLAHSLKTPLAVLRGDREGEQVQVQVDRIDRIVGYQLRKAATVGRQAFTQPIALKKVMDQIINAVSKVYRDKNVTYDVSVGDTASVSMDEGDLMEILGNVIDNGSKWCRSRVSISGAVTGGQFKISIEDDGPGFPSGKTEELLRRGVRADTQREGQGIGLAVVQEIVGVYGGAIALAGSDLGGAKVNISLPNY